MYAQTQPNDLESGGEVGDDLSAAHSPNSYPGSGAELVGRSPEFLAVTAKIPLLADCRATVLITGETGTGKELVAEAIHMASDRAGKPFIPVNCGALPEELVENELFGHAKGAYTGAAGVGRGLLAEAEGGTLFIDELNSLSMTAQAKLLRFVQNREFRMLGSTKLQYADVRIIAATNKDLRALVQEGMFREDLYHRLSVLMVELPSLRHRTGDIALLSEHFLSLFAVEARREGVRLTEGAHRKLAGYDWTGNVRELQSVMQRSLLLSRGLLLDAEDIELSASALGGPLRTGQAVPAATPSWRPPSPSSSAEGPSESFRDAKERVVKEFECGYLEHVLAAARGNVTHAARMAGMQRRDLQRLLRKHNLRREPTAG